MVSVPPKRTPPNIANARRRSSSSRMTFRKFLSQRTVMPYSATPPKPAITRSSSGSRSSARHRAPARKRDAAPRASTPESRSRQRLDLQAVDAHHRVPVVHEVVRDV
jgi:hypothetical protein